jgi:hypothetical protein
MEIILITGYFNTRGKQEVIFYSSETCRILVGKSDNKKFIWWWWGGVL